jgi:diacylglycerol kinase (ATP)
MHNEPEKLLFIINPISGGKEKTDWEVSIREYFTNKPQCTEFYHLNGVNDKASIKHYIERFNPSKVIAVGGDGTVKMLAEMLKETPIALGILPAGSANGMARELGIPTEVESALKIIEEGKVQLIDAIRINEEQLCIHLSDIGLNAMLVKYFESSPNRGMWGYGRAIIKMLFEKRKMRVSLTVDGELIKRKAYMVTLANARMFGTGAIINPDGNISDGVFEVVVVRKINLLEIYKSIFTNKTFHPRRIEVFPAKTVELISQRRVFFQVDGEYQGKTARLKARILPGILKMILPAD